MSDLLSPRSLALAFGILSICYGVKALIYPSNFADEYGFPSDKAGVVPNPDLLPKGGRSPFVIAYGGRTIALGAAIVLLAWENEMNAAGSVVFCCAISGMIDTVNCYLWNKPMLQHAIGAVALSAFGVWLRSQ